MTKAKKKYCTNNAVDSVLMDTIREICSENGNGEHGAKLEDIIVREKTLTGEDVKDYISKLKSYGEILETSHNRFNVAR